MYGKKAGGTHNGIKDGVSPDKSPGVDVEFPLFVLWGWICCLILLLVMFIFELRG